MDSYKVVRLFRDSGEKEVIRTGLTLKEAQAHCKDPETSSRTCSQTPENVKYTEEHGPWFDSYTEE